MTSPKPFGAPASKAEEDSFEMDIPSKEDQMKVPIGENSVRLVGLEKSTSNAGNPMWVWTLIVTDGPGAGEELKVYTALTPAAMWKATEALVAFDLANPGDTATKVKFAKSDAIGRRCIAVVVQDEYNGAPKASVKTLKKHPKGAVVPASSGVAKPGQE